MSASNQPILMSNKTTTSQYRIMLKFMQRHGDLCAPSGGGEGKLQTKLLWKELTSNLNAVTRHDSKTSQKWSKIWSDWKARTKKKALSIHTAEKNTNLILTDLECQLMQFLGWQVIVAEGNQDDCCISDKPYRKDKNPTALDEDISYGDINYDSQDSFPEPSLTVQQIVDHEYPKNLSDPLSQQCYVIEPTDSPEPNKKIARKRALNNFLKQTRTRERIKKCKLVHKRALQHESRMEIIMEKYADIETKRLEVELLKEKNEERRLAALEQSNNNQGQFMNFMHHMKGVMESFLTIYSAKNS